MTEDNKIYCHKCREGIVHEGDLILGGIVKCPLCGADNLI